VQDLSLSISQPDREFIPRRTLTTNAKSRFKVETIARNIRVVTLEDGETIHNAFRDRDFKIEDIT
jgi:hypothetical protein